MTMYKTVRQAAQDEFVEKRSRFIGYIKPVKTSDEALAFIQQIKTKHWDATHNVYAYVIRDEGVERYSDDNEPQGTAGIPVLEVLRRRELTDTVIVVTRYFGGTLLGAGGLVRAYSHAAKLAVDAAGEALMALGAVCTLVCSYTLYGRIPALVSKYDGKIDDADFADEVSLRFRLPEEDLAPFNKELAELSNGKCQATCEFKEFFEK